MIARGVQIIGNRGASRLSEENGETSQTYRDSQQIDITDLKTDICNVVTKEKLALNAISPYYTMFPITFPLGVLRSAHPGDWVLDPFCGRGTTVFAARLLGMNAVGYDTNRVAVAITKAKLVKVKPSEIVEECSKVLERSGRESSSMPDNDFWSLAYHHDTLKQLCALRNNLLEDCETDVRIALRAIILGGLHGPLGKNTQSYLSNQMPRTYSTKPGSAVKYWRRNTFLPEKIDLLEIVSKRSNRYFSNPPDRVLGYADLKDSRTDFSDVSARDFKWVITSPPYLGMTTYSTDQWLREWFLGGPESPNYGGNKMFASGNQKKLRDDLTLVWKNVSKVSNTGSHLVVRFGALPSRPYDYVSTIRDSIEYANSDWEIETIKDAGVSENGQRQSSQFLERIRKSIREVDVYAKRVG